MFGKSDPFLIFKRRMPDDSLVEIARTEVRRRLRLPGATARWRFSTNAIQIAGRARSRTMFQRSKPTPCFNAYAPERMDEAALSPVLEIGSFSKSAHFGFEGGSRP